MLQHTRQRTCNPLERSNSRSLLLNANAHLNVAIGPAHFTRSLRPSVSIAHEVCRSRLPYKSRHECTRRWEIISTWQRHGTVDLDPRYGEADAALRRERLL